MRFFRHLVATLCLGAFGLSAVPAHAAGTLTLSPPQWTKRVDGRPINVLNRQDCLDGATASFSYKVSGLGTGNGVFEVWSGAGCDNKDSRNNTTTGTTCTRVKVGSTAETRIDLNFQEMVKAYGLTEDAGVDACDTPQGAGTQNRSLYFVLYDQNTFASLATSTPWAFSYDIVAPPPPSNVTATAGDMTLITNFTPPSGETNLLHYHFYCSLKGPSPSAGTAGSAGSGGTAGTDTGGTAGTDIGGTAGTDIGGTDTGGTAGTDTGGTDTGGTEAIAGTETGGTGGTAGSSGTSGSAGTSTTLDADCTSSILVAGEPPPADAIDCGTIGALTASGGETDPKLQNGGYYVVAVATEDDANNVGVLSGLACGRPLDVTGFYEAYTEAGGQAGGGYCTFAPAQRDALWTGAALLLAAGAFWRRRK